MGGAHRREPADRNRSLAAVGQARIAGGSWWHHLLRRWFDSRPRPLDDQWTRAATPVVLPESLGTQFLRDHPTVALNQLALVQSAFLQWVRIEGRNPGGHAIPSHAVLEMFALLRREEEQWMLFCCALPLNGRLLSPLGSGTYGTPQIDKT